MRTLVRLIFKLFYGKILYHIKYYNKEKIRDLDKCIICPNHSNTSEPCWIYADNKNMSIMAKAELFDNKFIGAILKYFGVFPIRRGEKDVKSIIHAINLFKDVDKRKLLIFPEGERVKKDIARGTAKVGPAYIAYKAGVPIVPTYITKDAKKFSRVNVIYGEPIYVTEEIGKDKEKLQKFSDDLLDTIYNLKDSINSK